MKTVIVTGANRGIGLGLCQHYLKQNTPEPKWHLVAACRTPEQLPDEIRHAAHVDVIPLDLSSESSINGFASALSKKHLNIDVLINNAGVSLNEPFGDWSSPALSETFSVNATGPALLIQALSRMLSDQAKIIQMSSGLGSIASAEGDQSLYCAYAMSKACVNMLTRQLGNYFATHLANKKLCVAAINPGWVKTDMGGQQANDDVPTATQHIADTIELLTHQDSGQFYDYKKRPIPW